MYHISDIRKFIRCPRYYYLSKDNHVDNISYINNDEDITLLFAKKLGITDYYLGVKNDSPLRVKDEFNNYEWFIKARFEANGLRVKIPIIHRLKDSIDVYFTYYGLYPKDNELDFYRLDLEVLKLNSYHINNIFIIRLNENYIYQDEIDYEKLFIIDRYLYSKKSKASYLLNDLLKYRFNFKRVIEQMERFSLKDCKVVRKRMCKSGEICPFYHICYRDESSLDDDNILTLVACKNKYLMYKRGVRSLKDADINLIEGSQLQYAQIMASRNHGLFYDLYPIKAFLKNLEARPISFIDFEWDRYLIPKYKGLKALDVVCFEFALYILDEKGELHHQTFIGKGDCRKEFIEKLIAYLPKSGPIVAYNAYGAEVLRLKELARQFPEYVDSLNVIISRFVDISKPFIDGLVYMTKMRGDFSLKSLVKAISNYSYDNMDIRNGMEAVNYFRNLNEFDEQHLEDLKRYCSLDAYGLYLVYDWLLKLV